jgi:hypothetical protein
LFSILTTVKNEPYQQTSALRVGLLQGELASKEKRGSITEQFFFVLIERKELLW